MKIAVPVLLGCSLISAAIALAFLSSTNAQQKYWRAHEVVEKIAFGKAPAEGLQAAVAHERLAEKNLYLHRGFGTKFVWISAVFTFAALVVTLLPPRKPDESKKA